jgi:hypothetical protein
LRWTIVLSCWGEVDHLTDSGGVFVTGDHEGAGLDLAGIAGLVEEGPDVAGFVFVVEVGGDVHVVHLSSPLARLHF